MPYATIDEVKAEGLGTGYSDAHIQARLDEASAIIDRATGWWFDERAFSALSNRGIFRANGRGHSWLHLRVPVVTVDEVRIITYLEGGDETETLDATQYRVHNSVESPDDRRNPKLTLKGRSLVHGLTSDVWPKGHGNVEIDGTFGFLERDPYDGSLRTPLLITRATILLAGYMMPALSDIDANEGNQLGPVTSIRVADRSETYDASRSASSSWSMTGYTDVDRLIAPFLDRRNVRVT